METETQKEHEERVVRILSKDIEGKMKVYPGLTKIKGISWSLSNAICKKLEIDKNRKIGSLTKEEIKKITEFIKQGASEIPENQKVPKHIMNRRADFKTGKDIHLLGSDLELQTEFDIKRLKKIKSYRGYRHMAGLPTRGQRTKGHFRSNRRKGAGIKNKERKKQ